MRTLEQIVLAHIEADDNGARPLRRSVYLRFVEGLRADGLDALTAECPVLARRLAAIVDQWRDASAELLTRVHDDRVELAARFGLPPDVRLSRIEPGLSDPHHGGRSVALLVFAADAAEETHRIVYKPKDLRLDEAFHRMLSQAPAPTPGDSPLPALAVLARDGYGYMEWAPHRPCANDGELRAFYRNAGRLAAILHLLGCTDAHHENFIASGGALHLIDCETLFEGVARASGDAKAKRAPTRLEERLANSVIRTGLLPQWRFIGRARLRRDVSALGVAAPRKAERKISGWLRLNTDGMIAGDTVAPSFLPTSLPTAVGAPNRLGEFAQDLCAGFRDELESVARDKRLWLAEDGFLSAFRGLRRRFLPRPTWFYLWLRAQLLEPAALASEAAQRLLLEELGRRYLVGAAKPPTWPLFAAETAQMDALDVPFFELGVEDHGLPLPDGAMIEGLFELSGLENARRKIGELDGPAIDFEAGLVSGMIAAKHAEVHHRAASPVRTADAPAEQPEADRLHEARAIGDRLVGASIAYDEGAVEWLGIDAAEDAERSVYGPLGPSLYGGRAGVALFLAALSERLGADGEGCRRTARGALSDVRDLIAANDEPAPLSLVARPAAWARGRGGNSARADRDRRDRARRGERDNAGCPRPHRCARRRAYPRRPAARHHVRFGGPHRPASEDWDARGASPGRRRRRGPGRRAGRLGRLGDRVRRGEPLTGFSHGASGVAAALARLYAPPASAAISPPPNARSPMKRRISTRCLATGRTSAAVTTGRSRNTC